MIARAQRRQETAYESEHAEHRANETSLAKSTRTIARFTVALVAVGILSAFVSFLQWHEMNSSGAQTDKLINTNAQLADTASKNLIATQRAWVGTSDASVVKSGPMSPVKGMIVYANSGREPAQFQANALEFVYTRNQWDTGVAGDEIVKRQNDCAAIQAIAGFRYAWPVQGFVQNFLHFPEVQPPQKGAAVWTPDIDSGGSLIAVQGCIVYKAFGEIHHTAFCYFYDAKLSDPNHLNICQVGNFVN